MLLRLLLIIHISVVSGLVAAEQKVISIPSTGMNRSFSATVVMPAGYASSALHYPVIYLLHGFGGDSRVWPVIADLGNLSDRYQLIFVCPTGERSWYMNSPVNKKSQFETYITVDVIGYIDKKFRTWPQADGRAIIGTSMGGHGALTLLARHPDLFCGGGSISGVLDLTEFPDEWDLAKILGPYDKNRLRWNRLSFTGQIRLLAGKNKGIILDCGTDDFALAGNRKAHQLLEQAGILHEYMERDGGHTPAYSAKVIEFHVEFLSRLLKKAL
jgi:S-formylglutathione hydrolase FrmB